MGLLDAFADPQFRKDVVRGLLDAGNRGAVAGLLGGPVDLATMALRPLGYNVEQPVGGSEWIGQKMQNLGLVSEKRNPLAEGLAAFAGPMAAQQIAPKVFAAELRAMENMSNAPYPAMRGQMGGVLIKPVSGDHYRTEDLSQYTPNVFRETSVDRANDFLPGNMTGQTDLWFANQPEYALGQGSNKGVLMEFDAKNLPGQLSLAKPGARESYERGMAEFITRDADQLKVGENLRSIKISPEQQKGPYFRRLQNSLSGWGKVKNSDGSITFTKP